MVSCQLVRYAAQKSLPKPKRLAAWVPSMLKFMNKLLVHIVLIRWILNPSLKLNARRARKVTRELLVPLDAVRKLLRAVRRLEITLDIFSYMIPSQAVKVLISFRWEG